MGVCASCLGLNRHPSHDADLDRILDSVQPTYGTLLDDNAVIAPDEEELRREREALEYITAQATDHMIDVLHPVQGDLDNNLRNSLLASEDGRVDSASEQSEAEIDAEEAAWLDSIQAVNPTQIHAPAKGALVMDISLLRNGAAQTKTLKEEAA